MSVRKEYSVIVNGESVFSGSYRIALSVYESISRVSLLLPDHVLEVLICFKP